MTNYAPVAPPPTYDSKSPIEMTSLGFAIKTFEDAWRFAQSLCAAGMVPKAYANHPGAVILIMQACSQLQIPVHVGLSNFTFINGRFGIMGDLAHALVLRSGKLKKGTDLTVVYTGERLTPEWTCTVTVHRADQAEAKSKSFSIADATRAGLVKIDKGIAMSREKGGGWGTYGPWAGYTERQLYYRAWGFLVRDVFPDVLMGFYTTEELRDVLDDAKDVTPAHQGPGPGADPLLTLGEGQPALDFSAEAAARPMEVVEARKPSGKEEQTGLFVAAEPEQCTHQHPDGRPAIELRANPEGDDKPALEICTRCGEPL